MYTSISDDTKKGTINHRRLGGYLVAVVTFVAYIGTLQFPFVFDDWLLIVNSPRVQSWRWVPGYFTAHLWAAMPSVPADYYRPVFLLWLRVNHAIFGLHPFGWHLTTVLVFACAAVMVYVLALRLTQRTWVAIFVGLIFALHPSHVETGAWICDSLDPIALIMFIGSFLCWLRYRETKSAVGLTGSILLYAGAMLTKEPAIVLPGLLVAYEWIWSENEQSLIKRIWKVIRPGLIFLPLSIAYLVIRVLVLRGFSHPIDHPSLAQILLTIPWVVFFYMRILFWPVRLSAFYDSEYLSKPGFYEFVLPVIVIVIFCAVVLYILHKLPEPRMAKFGMAWFLLTLLPTLYLPTFSASELVHDRYVYMASGGLFLFLGSVISQVKIGRRKLTDLSALSAAIMCITTAGLFWMTITQQTYWGNDLLLYTRGVQTAPHNGLPAMNLGIELMQRRQYEKAYSIFDRLVRQLPTNPGINYNFGILNYRTHNYPQAIFYLERAIEYAPKSPEAYVMLGIIHDSLGRPDLAIKEISKSIELVPDGKGLHGALSEALEDEQDYEGALREAEVEAQISPENPEIQLRIKKLKSVLTQNQFQKQK